MAPEPWTITKRKRHVSTPATEGSSRQKRARLSVTPSTDGQGRQQHQQKQKQKQKQKQQTLTQAQWIPSRTPSFQDDPNLKPLKVRARSVGTPNQTTARNRNSTLTQMDFFRDIHVREGEDKLDDRPLDDVEAAGANLARLDRGVDSHPTKPRSRSRSRSRSPVKSTVNYNKTPQRKNVGQAVYEPSEKRRKQERHSCETTLGAQPTTVRRTSSRVADREARHNKNDTPPLGDTDPSKNWFGEDSHAVSGRDQVLEIQESIETDEEDEVQLPRQSPLPPQHHTPKRVILSSQSPERAPCLSLVTNGRGGGRRSTARKAALVAEERGDTRSPLREKSVNLPPSRLAAMSKTCDKPAGPSIPRSQQRQRKASPRKQEPSKIVSLKLPKRGGSRRLKVEDSQAPLWSLPLSSASSKLGNESNAPQDHYSGSLRPVAEADKREESNEEVEIPATSQVEEVEVCLAEEGSVTVTASEADGRVKLDQSLPPVTNVDGEQSTGKEITAPPPKTPPRRAAAAAAAEQEESSDIDFDSPIANDTQFNAEVARRLTTTPPSSSPLLPHATGSDDLFAIPTPRLIHSSSRPGRSQANNISQQQQQESNQQTCSEDIPLPPAPQTQTRTTTTLVPLNDTLMPPPRQHQRPSSSSSSPPSPQSHSSTVRSTANTQMSLAPLADVRPASLPHSSQISTQEATQFAFLSSLVPTAPEFSEPSVVNREQITIKEDSNSIGMLLPLSQIPQVKREESQIVDLGLEEGNEDEDEDEEEEEVDLNERLNKQHQYHVAEAADATTTDDGGDGDLPRTRIKQESQLDQSAVAVAVAVGQENDGADAAESQRLPPDSPSSSPPPPPSPPNHSHSPIPGFDNETQSNFTQGGHVTAAYIHRQRDLGLLPKWYTPKPYRVPGYTRR